MKNGELVQADQALFGYADGHRQIAASVRLPSKDQFQLAAATDLATGARLGPDESYLSGLPLSESRRYALIKTWPAPEMPRPGCVWSHVILLDSRLLSSYGDLSDFLAMFRRPSKEDQSTYEEPLLINNEREFRPEPDRRTLRQLIHQYYSGDQVILRTDLVSERRDAAIFAMWSQQWPRLRLSFSFRTAQADIRRRSELVDYSVQVQWNADAADADLTETSCPAWVIAAESDAAMTSVTALRRFLWRYGRDLSNPRGHFKTLVELYLAVREPKESWVEAAVRVFESLPEPGDGDILKNDILGIGSTSPSLIPPLSPSDLVRLLSSQRIQDVVNQDQMRKRFEVIPPGQVAHLAHFVVHHREELGAWEEAINAGLVASATQESVADDLPGGIRKLILLSRPDLISPQSVATVPNDDLIELAYAHQGDPAAKVLVDAVVRRDIGQSNAKLFKSMPLQVFGAAIAAAIKDELNPAWAQLIAENSALILGGDWPNGVSNTSELAVGLLLMRFPRNSGKPAEEWAAAIDSMKDDVSGEDRIRLQAFLLREALQDKTSKSWRLITMVLPELRPIIRADELPKDVYQTLVNDLPKFNAAAYWDLDKRILLSLSQLHRVTPNEKALRALDLSAEDEVTVRRGSDDEEVRSKSRYWWF